jgi:hypothetical protein
VTLRGCRFPGMVAAGCRAGFRGAAERFAGAVPVSIGDGTLSRDLAGQRLAGGPSGAERGEDQAAGAGRGQVAVADGCPARRPSPLAAW